MALFTDRVRSYLELLAQFLNDQQSDALYDRLDSAWLGLSEAERQAVERFQVLTDPWFQECVRCCVSSDALLIEYDRLRGTNLTRRGDAFQLEIDQATGRFQREVEEFLAFVKECVYDRVPPPKEQRS